MYNNYTDGNNPLERIHFADTTEEMHRRICDNVKKYALFDANDRFMLLNNRGCLLQPIGNYNDTWTTFSLKKNFRYTKTINSA